jgi:hypothetical protein
MYYSQLTGGMTKNHIAGFCIHATIKNFAHSGKKISI